jgi:molybdenum cofactor cytidylyltransferase
MGVGGLLMEIVTRPQPREEPAPEAGRASPPSSSRPGARRAWAVRTSCSPRSAGVRWCGSPRSRRWRRARGPVIVVTGHQHEQVEAALAGPEVERVHNPDFADGLSTSLRTGLAALPADIDGASSVWATCRRSARCLIDR